MLWVRGCSRHPGAKAQEQTSGGAFLQETDEGARTLCQRDRHGQTSHPHGAARKLIMTTSMHCHERYANNRADVSHEHTRAQERQMRRFKSPGQAQRFLAVHSQVHNLFRVGRHLLRAANYRLLRTRSFETWQQVTCAC